MSNDLIVTNDQTFNLSNLQSPINLKSRDPSQDRQDSPLTFKEWVAEHTFIASGKEFSEYNLYLKSWYKNREQDKADQVQALKDDYVNFLRELALFFKDDDDYKWLSDINFDDNLDIEDAIPFFVKKIKEIAIYLVQKRESMRKAKLKYSMAGATQATEKLFYEYLLKAFTKKNSLLEVREFSGYEVLPELSSVIGTFKIQVQELFDDTMYFDKDPTAASFYTTTGTKTSAHFETMDYPLSSIGWIYESGFMELCSNNPLSWTLQSILEQYGVSSSLQLPLSATEMSYILDPRPNEINMGYASEKYLANDVYALTGGYYIPYTIFLSTPIKIGNNWFNWLSGEFYIDNIPNSQISPIALSATTLIESGAVASNDYRDADKIFVDRNGTVKGAWLRNYTLYTESAEMSCAISDGSVLQFRFPYPSYGILGEDSAWTGRGLNNLDDNYRFLDDTDKRTIDELYWAEMADGLVGLSAIPINDTTLVRDGAFAAQMYEDADKISKRRATNPDKIHDSQSDGVYTDDFSYAWLYKFVKTDLPIKTGKSEYMWPVQRLDSPDQYVFNPLSGFCTATTLADIDIDLFLGARAGYGLADSDIIYKLSGRGGYPVECAFLKGYLVRDSIDGAIVVTGPENQTTVSNVTGCMQIGLTIKAKPDSPETFMWQDENTSISDVGIGYVKHQEDCPFLLYSKHESIFKQKDNKQFEFDYPWEECNCKAVLYSPIGHIGEKYSDYNGMADIIVLDTQHPTPFNLSTWRDEQGRAWDSSPDFAWYKITKTTNIQNNDEGLDVDVGMGVGSWVTGDGSPFTLQEGKQYKYVRSGMGRTYNELVGEYVPPIIIKYNYAHARKPFWAKATLGEDGNWVESSDQSDMDLNAGDYVMYDHVESNWYCLRYNGTHLDYLTDKYPTSSSNIEKNMWVNYTFATTGIPIQYKWPDKIYSNVYYGPEAYLTAINPTFLASELSAVTWAVSSSLFNYQVTISPEQELTVISYEPTNISVTVTGSRNGGPNEIRALPSITIVAPIKATVAESSGQYDVQTIYSDTVNYVLNVPLFGWNYSTSQYDGSSVGARPFWGDISNKDDVGTKYKGIDEWGYGLRVVDEYCFIHQPPISPMTLGIDEVISYDRTGEGNFLWKQPLEFIVNEQVKEWCALTIDSSKTHPLSAIMGNIVDELVVYPTSTISDITLEPSDIVNYWSNTDFTWFQTLSDISEGSSLFGATFVPFASTLVIRAIAPYANLTNRHYPTIAVYPHLEGMFTEKDSGGYYTPRMLGANTFVGNSYVNDIDPTLVTNTLTGIEIFFKDPQSFISKDVGLSEARQKGPIVVQSVDSSWMKATLMEGAKAGEIRNASEYKEFIPYQAKAETNPESNLGIRIPSDEMDPWYKEFDNDWKDTTFWPPNFRKENKIRSWYEENNIFVKQTEVNQRSKSITVSVPYLCPDVQSMNLADKDFTNTYCIGCPNKVSSVSGATVISTTTPMTAIGNIIMQLNGDYIKNTFVPLYSATFGASSNVDFDNVLYGEMDNFSRYSYPEYIHFPVNGIDNSYLRIYSGRRTNECCTDLIVDRGNGCFNWLGYVCVSVNETEKYFTRYYEKVDVCIPPSSSSSSSSSSLISSSVSSSMSASSSSSGSASSSASGSTISSSSSEPSTPSESSMSITSSSSSVLASSSSSVSASSSASGSASSSSSLGPSSSCQSSTSTSSSSSSVLASSSSSLGGCAQGCFEAQSFGDATVNGVYSYSGEFNGKPYYQYDNYVAWWDNFNNQWAITTLANMGSWVTALYTGSGVCLDYSSWTPNIGTPPAGYFGGVTCPSSSSCSMA